MEKQADVLSERFLVFASKIVKLVKDIDSNQFHRHIGMQLFRSATAIGANSCSSMGFCHTMWNRAAAGIVLLKILKKTHRLFLLSNTNSIHYPVYNAMIQKMGEESIDSLFDRAYYSFREGMRKPEPEFFQKVIRENQLNPGKTLFVDDTEMHVEAAMKLGLHAVHLAEGQDMTDLFSGIFG